jgi:hypothetical protein
MFKASIVHDASSEYRIADGHNRTWGKGKKGQGQMW